MGLEKQKICLLEIGGSHFECMETQIHFLKNDFHLTLLANADKLSKATALIPNVDEVLTLPFPAKKSFTLSHSLKIAWLLKKHDFDYVLLNTAQGGIKWVCLFSIILGTKARFLGVLHNVHKLKKGIGQMIISQCVTHYFVFGEYLEKYTKTFSQKKISSFLPIFVQHENLIDIQKPEDEFWVCIPGNIEFKRRDYLPLLDALSAVKISAKVKFVLLGSTQSSDAKILLEKINELNVRQHFILFDTFVDHSVFNTFLSLCDCILPLLAENSTETKLYQTCKVSGSWLHVLTFHKPLFSNVIFSHIDDIQNRSIFYNNLKELLEKNLQQPTPEMFSGLVTTDVKQDFDYQKQLFLKHFK